MDRVEVRYSEQLGAVLSALGIRWTWGLREGGGAVMWVEMDRAADGLLEQLVGDLSRIRWGYKERELQLGLPWVEGVEE